MVTQLHVQLLDLSRFNMSVQDPMPLSVLIGDASEMVLTYRRVILSRSGWFGG